MTDQTGVSVYGPGSGKQSQTLRVGQLVAEYSTGQTPSGDYFALGTIRGGGRSPTQPAWIIIGTGSSKDDAVQHLGRELENQLQRL